MEFVDTARFWPALELVVGAAELAGAVAGVEPLAAEGAEASATAGDETGADVVVVMAGAVVVAAEAGVPLDRREANAWTPPPACRKMLYGASAAGAVDEAEEEDGDVDDGALPDTEEVVGVAAGGVYTDAASVIVEPVVAGCETLGALTLGPTAAELDAALVLGPLCDGAETAVFGMFCGTVVLELPDSVGVLLVPADCDAVTVVGLVVDAVVVCVRAAFGGGTVVVWVPIVELLEGAAAAPPLLPEDGPGGFEELGPEADAMEPGAAGGTVPAWPPEVEPDRPEELGPGAGAEELGPGAEPKEPSPGAEPVVGAAWWATLEEVGRDSSSCGASSISTSWS